MTLATMADRTLPLAEPPLPPGSGWATAGEYTRARDKTDEALAAWRALGEVQP
jgi:hypothetical protein